MEPEIIEIYDDFIINPEHIKEIYKDNDTHKKIPSKPFDIILHMKRLNDSYGLIETVYHATLYLHYNVKYEDILKYYSYYKVIRMVY